jgi:hypothetical protein
MFRPSTFGSASTVASSPMSSARRCSSFRPEFSVRHLAAAEHDGRTDLGALLEEATDVTRLRPVVVPGDLGPHLDLLDRDAVLALPGVLVLLFLLVPVLAPVHDAADRRVGLGGDLDEVEILLTRTAKRLCEWHDADLGRVRVHEADARDLDLGVDPALLLVDARLLLVVAPVGHRPDGTPTEDR